MGGGSAGGGEGGVEGEGEVEVESVGVGVEVGLEDDAGRGAEGAAVSFSTPPHPTARIKIPSRTTLRLISCHHSIRVRHHIASSFEHPLIVDLAPKRDDIASRRLRIHQKLARRAHR